jgi:outer membrane protein TolC
MTPSIRIYPPQPPVLLALCGLLVAGWGCRTPEAHIEATDREVYSILEERRAELGSSERPFTIDPSPDSLRQRLLRQETQSVGPLDLVDCLAIAAENSRTYQDSRETLYLAALDLTLERYRFSLQKSAGAGALLNGDGDGASDFQADAGLGLTRMLGNGALVVANIGTSLFHDLVNADGWHAVNDIGLAITQPLLAGSSRRIVQEPLTQAERNVVYAVRSFESFRRDFSVDVATRYYRLLQQDDTVQNETKNFANLTLLRERNEALAEAGRLTDVQVDQARQDELRSKNRLIDVQQRLDGQLDGFKLFLGLPITTRLELDPSEMGRLVQEDLKQFDQSPEDLEQLAMTARLDYLTSLDRIEDAGRRVDVAADALRAVLNVTGGASWSSEEGRPLEYAADDLSWSLQLDLDLPIDRFAERNRYREALISLRAAERDADLLADQIRVNIRDDLRELTTTLESYRIQSNSVELNERRVESANLNLEAGRVSTRDLLEAQEDLVTAQNQATLAMIDFILARLALYRDLELLEVTEQGILVPEVISTIPAAEQP